MPRRIRMAAVPSCEDARLRLRPFLFLPCIKLFLFTSLSVHLSVHPQKPNRLRDTTSETAVPNPSPGIRATSSISESESDQANPLHRTAFSHTPVTPPSYGRHLWHFPNVFLKTKALPFDITINVPDALPLFSLFPAPSLRQFIKENEIRCRRRNQKDKLGG